MRGSRGGSVFEEYVKIYHNAPKVRRFVTVDGDFCWALGLVIAEGSKSSISLHEDELGLANKFLDIYKKITGLEFENSDKFYFREDVKSLHVAIPSPKIYEALFFKACGIGYGARNKSMAIGFEMSEKLVLKLIQGMHAGDGCTQLKGKYKSWRYKTSSETLAYQLQATLSTKLNIKSTLSQGMNKERYIGNRLLKESNYFDISVNHSSDIATLEGVEVGNILQEKQKGFVVTNIEPSDNTYYDITLQDGSSHKFIIDGGIVTHNCGGANMIDKVPDTFKRIGYDLNGHVIQAMIDIRDNPESLLDKFSAEEREFWKKQEPTPLFSHACIVTSFGGDFRDGGYAREKGSDDTTFCGYGKRNALKQSPKIQGVQFICDSYENLDFENCIIYNDPPYKNSRGYKTGKFDHDKFFDWCREQAKKNVVFVSEYNAPDDFELVWQGEIKTNFASNRKKATHNAVEKLFKVNINE